MAVTVNAGWALQRGLPWFIALNALAMVAALLWRRTSEVPIGARGAWIYAGCAMIIAGSAWIAGRRRFIGSAKALARLDAVIGGEGRLLAAAEGKGVWPEPPARAKWGMRFNGLRPFLAAMLSLALLGAGLLWPISRAQPRRGLSFAQGPETWERLESMLDAIELSELVEDTATEALQDRFDALRDQPKEDWYSPAGLEAASYLESQTRRAAEAFLQELQTASYNAMRLSNGGDAELARANSAREFNESLAQLDMGTLPLRRDLMDALKELAANNPGQLSPDAMRELLDRLEQGANACRQGMGLPPFKLEEFKPEMAQTSGGPDGGGPAPLTFRGEGSPEIAGNPGALSNPDLERAILGDTAYTATYHSEEYDPDYGGLETSGRSDHLGEGGAAVWKTRARPDERAALRNFYSE